MKMNGKSNKYILTYYLVDQLDAAKKYSKEEIEQFIASQVESSTYNDPMMALDHIRVAMVDNRFLIRNSNGSQYWVCESFIKPLDSEQINFEKLTKKEFHTGTEIVYLCNECGQQFKGIGLARHFVRNHTYLRQMEKIKRYLIEV